VPGMGIELEEAALAVVSGKRAVVEDADALSIIEASEGEPVPVALHRVGGWCTVLFITYEGEGKFRTDIVPVHDGNVDGWGGGEGGPHPLRSEVEPGKPVVGGQGQHFLDDETGLLEVDGVSADAAVRMRWQGEVVAEATVAAHGYFVLAAILPVDAEVTVEAA
jgi:hypothetical protein